jgi:hypothetical protein
MFCLEGRQIYLDTRYLRQGGILCHFTKDMTPDEAKRAALYKLNRGQVYFVEKAEEALNIIYDWVDGNQEIMYEIKMFQNDKYI